MATLSFLVKQKKTKKPHFNFLGKNIVYALISFLSVVLTCVVQFLLASNNIEYLQQIKKPSFFVNPVIYCIITAVVYIITAISFYLSYKYESKTKNIIALSLISLFLNMLNFVSLFVFNSIGFCVLVVVSNLVICCYYFKLLKQGMLATKLFIPYLVWLMFNVVLTYSAYLLN